MKKVIVVFALVLALSSGTAFADSFDFAQDQSGNYITSDGVLVTIETTNTDGLKWHNKGLQINGDITFKFASPVSLTSLFYINPGQGNYITLFFPEGVDPSSQVVDVNKKLTAIDLSSYGPVESLVIGRNNTFWVNGLEYSPAPTPIPAAALLFASGLAGTLALRRKLG